MEEATGDRDVMDVQVPREYWSKITDIMSVSIYDRVNWEYVLREVVALYKIVEVEGK